MSSLERSLVVVDAISSKAPMSGIGLMRPGLVELSLLVVSCERFRLLTPPADLPLLSSQSSSGISQIGEQLAAFI